MREPGAAEGQEVPLSLVSSITCLGQVHLDQYVLRACLRHRVPVHLCTQAGALLGQLDLPGDAPTASLALALAQADFCRDEKRCLLVAGEMVAAKIANCREVLSRQQGRDQFDVLALEELKQAVEDARRATSPGVLRGIEGQAAALYFERWQHHLPEGFGFEGRSFRPAEDPLNALLNFGYALLYRQLSGLLQIERLNPHLGVFHRPSDFYHPLACDLQEEFRCLVDLLTLRLAHLGQVAPADFRWREKPQPGWWLAEEARRTVLKTWQERLEEPYRPVAGQPETTVAASDAPSGPTAQGGDKGAGPGFLPGLSANLMLYVVLYSVADPAGRPRIKRLLEGYGWEVAPGVFECPLGQAQAGELRSRLERMLGQADHLRMYQVCEGCLTRSWHHNGPEWAKKPPTWVF